MICLFERMRCYLTHKANSIAKCSNAKAPGNQFSHFWLLLFILRRALLYQREAKYIKVAHASCSQILAYQKSVYPVHVDELHSFGAARVIAYGLCIAISSRAYMCLNSF